MAETEVAKSSTTVAVPYLLNDPTLYAIKELEAAGFDWKLTGDPRQHSYVKDQQPMPNHQAAKGSTVTLHVVVGPTP